MKHILLFTLAAAAMLDANPGLRGMYDENDDNTAVYFLTDVKASINSLVKESVEINF